MIRKASIMHVFPDYYEEYKRRHDKLWPEMAEVLKRHGAHNYSIFLDEETGSLFAFLEIEDEEKWEQIAQTDICQKWWAYMEPLMETNPDNSPVSRNLKEVFYLE
ncbi:MULTISPECIES: L-rhamnose mutarotase [Paenibacillus]|uniref:L-rhamnose mutarotase n=1 Tax=Paenibacillus kribbensis TaxID=172713 RepID=A0A222WQH3_9BACL|nr:MULTISPECIES: L-rhamnose mutarotase [Paenibacillus]ASR48258.1 L-rhamnose mutarotase [Paenibacillus kribbensis]EHS58463.1 L-rhamnose mutarotase [Paenibacillus sp. Aloe-11]MBE0338890.1 L-rhamnose mutarotase [Paenibacillus sp. 23TSA30-6]MEC0233767.1 L-rhamnose mutarotase [Paenibacillus kribbensis]